MNFEQWLTANGYDADAINKPENAKQRKHLEAAFKAESAPVAEPVAEPAKGNGFHETMSAIEAENKRQQDIQQIATAYAMKHRGNPEKVKSIRDLCDAACADDRTTLNDFRLTMLHASRDIGPLSVTPREQERTSNDVLEAAVAQATGVANLDKRYAPQTLEAAHKEFRNGIGLKELLMVAARRNNGYRGSMNDLRPLCAAAFRAQEDHHEMRADVGPSTIQVTGILSNIANKFLEDGFLYAEQTWRQVARIRPLNDFKTATMYRLGSGLKFQKVAPTGELKAGTLSELSYTLKADEYGILIGLDRRDIINDDLGAFAQVSAEIGRGALDSLNSVFWTDTWLSNLTTFFPTNNSNSNYISGATTNLSLAGLNAGEVAFRLQTKPDGTLLGMQPKILLVPATLYNTALTLMQSMGLAVGTTPASGPDINIFRGRYEVATSAFLDGNSTTAWYLLAAPNACAAIQIGFLNGVDRPTVESSPFDFDRLGMAMRGYFDFGVAMMEYRAGIMSKGAA